jgi:putative hydrolase of the HAD superfamily
MTNSRAQSSRIVLFDLFGTLVPGGSGRERDDVSRLIANDFDVDSEQFAALIRATYDERMRGTLGDLRETLAHLAKRLGGEPSSDSVDRAALRRLTFTHELLSQTWAIPALQVLTASGIRVGVVSDCSAETPEIWDQSPIAPYAEATSFSCLTGTRKPAPEAYLIATRALQVDPTDCVFVGDGGSNELTGAESLGMTTYRYTPTNPEARTIIDPDLDWNGPEIRDLGELKSILRA